MHNSGVIFLVTKLANNIYSLTFYITITSTITQQEDISSNQIAKNLSLNQWRNQLSIGSIGQAYVQWTFQLSIGSNGHRYVQWTLILSIGPMDRHIIETIINKVRGFGFDPRSGTQTYFLSNKAENNLYSKT